VFLEVEGACSVKSIKKLFGGSNRIQFYIDYSLIVKKADQVSNSHFETNFECCSAYGAATPKIGFLKGSRRLPFKKPIFIMGIAGIKFSVPYY